MRSTAPTADQRPALTSPRVHRWARGVVFLTFHQHYRHRRSARGRRGHVGLRSVSRPGRDARCTCARCARLGGPGGAGGLGTKYRFRRTAEALTAACPSGCIHIGVARALARVLIASIDVAVARYLPSPISRCACMTRDGRQVPNEQWSCSLLSLYTSSRCSSWPCPPP